MFLPSLSVAIITFNEERIIEKTVSAVSTWVDEVIVVDSYSTDETVNILKKFDVKLYQRKWEGYSSQKNYAISKCTGEWIFSLDADEILTVELRNEILNVINSPNNYDGFKIKRKFYINNKWIRFGGYYPDYQLRLFKKESNALFSERLVHESLQLEGKTGFLKNDIEHYAYKSFDDYVSSLGAYAKFAANEIKDRRFYLPLIRSLWTFSYRYFVRLGFLEGILGFKLAKAYSHYVYDKYKLAEELRNKSREIR